MGNEEATNKIEPKKEGLKAKIKNGLKSIKAHWRVPPDGYQVCYKEFLNYALGFGGLSFLSILNQWTGIAVTTYMMISYFKLSSGVAFALQTVMGSIFALIRSPILSMIIDNRVDKKGRGKFKQFLIRSAVLWALFMGLIPFIPSAWNEINLFSVTIPAMKIFGILEPSKAVFTLGVVVMFLMYQIAAFYMTLLNQAMNGIEQTFSSNSQERANLISIKGLICNIPGSLVNVLMPVVAGILFADSGHQLNINLYRIFFPICMVFGVAMIFFTYFGVEERVIIRQKHQNKVKFFEGAKELSKNKYFWIIAIFSVTSGLRASANITGWICQFSFTSSTAKTLSNLFCTTILMNAFLVGMLTGPILIKKFGKRNLMVFSSVGYALMIVLQLLTYKNPYLVLASTFLQNIFGGYAFVPNIMTTDALDYQQWKTGKRLEGFWQNYSAVITTIIGVFTGMLQPLFLSMAGISFGDDVGTALKDEMLRNAAYRNLTLLGLIAAVICIVPFLFYDLNEKKHQNIIRVLKLRAACDDFDDELLTEEEITDVKEIMDFAEQNNDEFLNDEIKKHERIHEIYEMELSSVSTEEPESENLD